MMKFFLFTLFLIPLINNWWLLMNLILLSCFLFFINFISIYYSNLSYSYGVDMVSFWMILLSIWIVSLMIMASFKIKSSLNSSDFLLVNIILLLFLMLSFSCTNLFIFYLWFEAVMIPTLILIFGWGYQPERLMAGLYLLFYTLFASLPMLLGIFFIYNTSFTLYYFLIDLNCNLYLYLSMILSFLIKMPMFFVHFWLPKAHVEAPVSGSMILAGVLLKLGGYGLFRVLNFIYMYNMLNILWIVISLFGSSVVGILCLCQIDIKSMIAYSSVSHMGLVIAGLMTCNYYGLYGSLILMLGHGLCSSGLFALANIMYERSHSRSILINKGFLIFMPNMSMFWFLLSINNMSSPPSLNLLGEILLINSLMSWSNLSFVFLGLTSFFSCGYSIYLYSITQHGSLYSGLKFNCYGNVREFNLIMFHWIPLNFLFMKSEIFSLWI
uniref:NADH-ubiquinone oxidoreductase chain 4 n=1 Tax=Geocoris pallidipennis TaxID=300797 RepID=B7SMC2_GEOPA|nr:NADH dehydrogenase subunit 4 [Geocoris pallidipennis]ABZ02016.1 NADH dehydrogenase subunit 4 [Geocoris pallidipennis]